MDCRKIIEAFQLAAEKRHAERTAFEEYGGYSWGYHGYSLIKAADEAERRAAELLEQFIDSRIAKATGG